MAKQIFIAVTNDLYTDQRVLRVAKTLTDSGNNVKLIGRMLPKSRKLANGIDYKLFKLWLNKGPWFYASYNCCLFFYLLFHKFDVVLSNDLDTLLACYLASKIKRKPIVYDSHEYFTEVPELIGREFEKSVWLSIEKWIVPKLKYCYTVSGSIAAIYNKLYGTGFKVIRNLPLRKALLEIANRKVVMYQGALNIGRGVDLMIQAMLYLPDYELWIAGTGDIEQDLKALSNNLGLTNRVFFLGRLDAYDLHKKTSQAKIGLSLEENLGLNYYYSLPNKLFDYLQSGLPVIVSDLPEMHEIVSTYKVGNVLKERTPVALATLIKEMIENNSYYKQLRSNAIKAGVDLCWENESHLLLSIFNKALQQC